MKISTSLFVILSTTVLLFCASQAVALDKELSVVKSGGTESLVTGTAGSFVSVDIVVDNASVVAGAAFTVLYDTANLFLTDLTSPFFGTFDSQNIPTPNDQGFVSVDGEPYSSPLTSNTVNDLTGTVSTGTLIAAARMDDGTGTDTVLFTLTFELIGSPGTYTVALTQTSLNNTAAGYDAAGELIGYLVGVGEASNPYPTHDVPVTNDCSVVIAEDEDEDLIDDDWERFYVPEGTPVGEELNVFTADGDKDNDGYSDYQEYLNVGITDPDGDPFDPLFVNAPNGVGYVKPNVKSSFSILMMIVPVLSEAAKNVNNQ